MEEVKLEYSHIAESLRPLAVPINTLTPDSENARAHDRKNIEAIKSSLMEFGQDQPLVVQKEGRIIRKGNGRYTAAKELGWTHIAVVIVDETRIKAMRRALADNRTGELSDWDYDALSRVFTEFTAAGEDLVTLGWERDEYLPFLEAPILGVAEERTGELRKESSKKEKNGKIIKFSAGQWEKIEKSLISIREDFPKYSDEDCLLLLTEKYTALLLG